MLPDKKIDLVCIKVNVLGKQHLMKTTIVYTFLKTGSLTYKGRASYVKVISYSILPTLPSVSVFHFLGPEPPK